MYATSQLDNLRVVLVNTRNPLNIGAAARAMSNFGCLHLRVVNPFEDAWREARSAVGGAPLLADAEQFTSVADAVADCSLVIGTTAGRDRELNHQVRTPADAEPIIRQQLQHGSVALMFGSEKRGLSNEDLSHSHWLLRIPTREEHGSMNLGQAVAVCLYELARENQILAGTEAEKAELATGEELERMTALLTEALAESGYSDPASAPATEEKTRRLLHRLSPRSNDAELMTGMLRKILWKLRHS